MKREILIVIAIFLTVFISCKRSNNIEIGFLIHSTSNARWKMDVNYLNERSKELGATFVMKDAQDDENTQLKQADELLKQGVDVLIVVAANQNTAGGIVRAAHEKGVKVISYDRIIKNSDLDYLISFEYEKIGELMVEYVSQKKPQGNYILLWGDPTDANARFVQIGQERSLESISGSKNINVVYKTFVEGWSQVVAKQIVSKILDFYPGKIDAIISSNDPMALGAFEALTSRGYKPFEVLISGQDATLDACRSIVAGGVSMSVFKPIKQLAYGAVDLAISVAKGGKNLNLTKTVNNGRINVPSILLSPSIIDRSNLDEMIIGEGVFTREQIYN